MTQYIASLTVPSAALLNAVATQDGNGIESQDVDVLDSFTLFAILMM